MRVLVVYDIGNMNTPEGQARWRRVANICKAHGQRVQWSVFECLLTDVQLENFKHLLRVCIDEQQDSLRIYRLSPSQHALYVCGIQYDIDFEGPLVI